MKNDDDLRHSYFEIYAPFEYELEKVIESLKELFGIKDEQLCVIIHF